MTKKKVTITMSQADADVVNAQLESAQRGARLRKAEAEVRASKPGRSAQLRQAEAELAAHERPDPRCVYEGMTVAKPKPVKSNASAAVERYLRNKIAARRR
jgi:hypothetical protein